MTRDLPTGGVARSSLGASASPNAAISVASIASAGVPEASALALHDIGASRFTLGPFLTKDGFLLSDGAGVTVQLSDAQGRRDVFSGWIRDGYLRETRLISPADFPVHVVMWSALGRAETVIGAADEVAP